MSRNVFRPDEIAVIGEEVKLDPPFREAPPEEKPVEAEDVYLGPTAAELKAEAEQFREQWDKERESMVQAARAQADAITEQARQQAEETAAAAEAGRESALEQAKTDAAAIVEKAEAEARTPKETAEAEVAAAKKAGEDAGRAAGHEAGYAEGKAEVERLVQRAAVVLERIQDRRAEILDEAERQVVDLALLIARKVVKIISTSQREVVMANIKEALQKVKSRGKVIIKVNTADLDLATAHKDEFIKLVEGAGPQAGAMEVYEDSSVDQGGCVVETDFGEIDARVASQLGEIEAKILELSPMRT